MGTDLYRIAAEGLSRQGEPSSLLDPLAEILFEAKSSPAGLLQQRWLGEWRQEPLRLIEFCGRNTLKPTQPPGGSGAEDY
jgi:hypothetical protein